MVNGRTGSMKEELGEREEDSIAGEGEKNIDIRILE